MLFKFMLVEWRILPSAWLLISRSGKHWIKSHRSTLNSNVPSMKPCGTPKIISDLELYVQLNFILCFLLVKYGCNSSKERISTHNHEFQQFAVHEVNNQWFRKDQLVEIQRHNFPREIITTFQSLGVRSLLHYHLSKNQSDTSITVPENIRLVAC